LVCSALHNAAEAGDLHALHAAVRAALQSANLLVRTPSTHRRRAMLRQVFIRDCALAGACRFKCNSADVQDVAGLSGGGAAPDEGQIAELVGRLRLLDEYDEDQCTPLHIALLNGAAPSCIRCALVRAARRARRLGVHASVSRLGQRVHDAQRRAAASYRRESIQKLVNANA
jgi:hypothetical protein